MKEKYVKLDFICECRNVLFGMATLLVMYFHAIYLDIYGILGVNVISNILYFIYRIGNYGVDIFLFLSGIGLYFSLSKNSIGQFYKNRFLRIYPSFILSIVIINIILGKYSILDILSTLIGIPFFIDGVRDVWYVQFIVVLYLIFPFIYKIIKKYDIYGLCSSLFLVVLFNLIYSYVFNSSYFNLEVALTRIPVFLIGTYFGKIIYEKRNIHINWLWVSFFAQIIISLIIYIYIDLDIPNFRFIARYMYCFLAISSVINISWLLSFVKNNIIIKFLILIGSCSLEIYLVHEKIYGLLDLSNMFSSYVSLYMVGIIISILCAYCLKKLVDFGYGVYKKLVYK